MFYIFSTILTLEINSKIIKINITYILTFHYYNTFEDIQISWYDLMEEY